MKLLKISIVSLLVQACLTWNVFSADPIHLRDHWWHGKQFKHESKSDWHNVGLFSERIRWVLNQAPESVRENYWPIGVWRTVEFVGLFVGPGLAGWNLAADEGDKVSWAVVGAGSGVYLIAFIVGSAATWHNVDAYNAWTSQTSGLQLETGDDGTKLSWKITF